LDDPSASTWYNDQWNSGALVRDDVDAKIFMSQYPGVMVSSTIAPTAEGNLAINTVEFVAAKEIVV
jgi:hypothetical protein